MIALPNTDFIWSPTYISYRRFWLDFYLEQFNQDMYGIIIDLGGKRENKRGKFRPPETQAKNWWYINLEVNTRPDILANVTSLPIPKNYADLIICTEVLEHLAEPAACVEEIYRILRPGGIALVSVPFIYPVHADPDDFQRFTANGIRELFQKFESIDIYPMGGYLGTLGMLMEIGIPGIKGQRIKHKVIRRSLSWIAKTLCRLDIDKTDWANPTWQKFTTGYFAKVFR